ncbi:myeloid-associated differentiation marker homolog-like [Megalobrama amblycephala]|uniref:myeloid-associated differentiation marker homolog-like n=1 Tax=Megalobrama amblycephala TaxID=75352 RepID=UPI00201445B2|nr:myeloid-associated differentiation marker homolog-like [Megalobrama amblycephala]
MVTLNTQSLTVPVGIIRLFEFVLTLITFSLVASVGHIGSASFWAWCMFTWCFCCFMTLLIIILELTSLNTKVPISWDDFTTAFAMLSTLMLLAASVIYPTIFVCSSCSIGIAATVISCVCFCLYAAEVGLTRAKPGEISGFLSTVPGLLKVLEAFVACIIFICLDSVPYSQKPGLQWCVAVYSICFIVALLIIILTIGRLLARCPFPLDKCMTGYNILAILMYITAMVIWPIYSFDKHQRPQNCKHCPWDSLVVVSCMTCINLIVYIVDAVYSVRLVFFVSPA